MRDSHVLDGGHRDDVRVPRDLLDGCVGGADERDEGWG